ncbi:MAG TPA: polysaccharide biosynthesis tyrosine autokinase [Polyangiales bacterium]|nr:polysaccharide biosynthesis tyrosine autokinase [Polyangiales bacterium]
MANTQAVDYLRILWKRKWLVVLVTLAVGGLTYLWTLRQPRIYQSDCSIEYDPNPPKPLGREVEEVAPTMPFWESREYFATQNKIISSRAVAEKVVRKLSLHENPDFWRIPEAERAKWKRATVSDSARILQERMTVTQERDTRLVHIRVKDANPERAMLLANTIADAYIEKTMEDRLSATTGALEWLGKQLDSLKRQLEQSELALHEFGEQHTNLAVSLEDQQNIVASNISLLSKSLIDARTNGITLEARLNELRAANNPDPFAVYVSGFGMNPALAQLRLTYQSLLRERDALNVQYGDAHPKVVATTNQLERVSQAMRAEIDGMITAAQSDLNQSLEIERGVQTALSRANRVGIELNLQEITYRRLQRERDNTSKLYGTLLERTAQTDLTRALQTSFVRIVDYSLIPRLPVSPRVAMNLGLGALFGLLMGIGFAFILEQMDRTIRTVEDAEALGVTVLGIMPKIDEGNTGGGYVYGRRRRVANSPEQLTNRDLVVHTHPKSSVAESCRTIRTNLTFMSADRPRRTLVITSANPREGKTTVTMSVAISLAQSGKRVLLVDTDLRKPRLHRALGKTLGKGVTTVLVGELSAKEAIQETEIPGLSFMASGPIPPNPSELLHTSQFKQLLTDLSKMFDQVIFDSPPLAAVTDAAIIAPQVDSAILIVHSERTSRDALRTALRQLRDVGCQPTGAILNEVDLSTHRYGYGSYYYYNRESYYTTDTDNDVDKKPPRPIAQA